MPFYFPPMPVELYLLLVVLSLPIPIIIWGARVPLIRKLSVTAMSLALLGLPLAAWAVIARDPCSADLPWWMRAITGCW